MLRNAVKPGFVALTALLAASFASGAAAQEITLKVVSAFP